MHRGGLFCGNELVPPSHKLGGDDRIEDARDRVRTELDAVIIVGGHFGGRALEVKRETGRECIVVEAVDDDSEWLPRTALLSILVDHHHRSISTTTGPPCYPPNLETLVLLPPNELGTRKHGNELFTEVEGNLSGSTGCRDQYLRRQ